LYEDFFQFFENLNVDFKINWVNLELFDKDVKVLEIFKGNNSNIKPFLRSFREEIVQENFSKKERKLKKIKKDFIDIENKSFLSFIKNYNTKNIKLILNYAS